MGNSSARDGKEIERAERARQALELRRAGLSFEEIGGRLGVRKGTAFKIVKRAIAAIPAPAVSEHRALELLRLDKLTIAVWRHVEAGDMDAVDRMLLIMKRRSALLGLDAPREETQVQIRVSEELEAAIARLRDALPADVFEQVLSALASAATGDAARAEARRPADAEAGARGRCLPARAH